jgi:catechol 2,3-dioxygenase-like lactoylglutathione lyase family enzyme
VEAVASHSNFSPPPKKRSVISHLDHLVLTVHSLEKSVAFYERVLGFRRVDTPGKPTALHFGSCKINVHEAGHTFEPKAQQPTPGSADFCLITDENLDAVAAHLRSENVAIETGPIARNGARGAMTSLYFRDPDGNLVEVSRYAA